MKRKDLSSQTSMEQLLEKEIKILISDAIGESPTDISCVFIGNSDVAILIEGVKTPLDDFLSSNCQATNLQKYRRGLKIAIGQRVGKLVEETVRKPIDQISMIHQTETRWMGIFSLV